MENKEKTLSKTIFLLPLVSVIVTALIVMAVAIISIYNMYQKNEQLITKNFMQNLKVTTKHRVMLTYNIIDALYKFEKDKNKTIKLMQKVLSKMRWDKKGYIFIFDYHGNTLYHPNHYYMTINRWNFERHGVKVIRLLILSALKHPKTGTYVKYLAYNPGGKPIEKISYVKIYEPLKIVIGNGVYLNYLNKKLISSKKEYKNLIMDILKEMIIIGIAFLFIILLAVYFLSKKVDKLFNEYIDVLEEQKQKLFIKAHTDMLTGLYNREFLKVELKRFLSELKYKNTKLALVFIDIDYFKEINDTHGHDMGDLILKEAAKRLKNCVRDIDLAVRFGGDEFIVVLNEIKTIDEISAFVQRIIKELKQTIIIENEEYHLTASIGISVAPDDTIDKNTLIKYADTAMYEAKRKGKDRFRFYKHEMGREAQKRLEIRSTLLDGLKNNEFVIYFQPQIDKNGKLRGMETLIRWDNPKKGMIFPNDFIPIAIEMGIIDDIDLWVIEHAIIQYNKWLKKGYNPGVLSCNLTIYQLEKGNFYETIMGIIKKHNFDVSKLALEITEEGIMKNPEKSIEMLEKLSKEGIKINIDDFGTGYSSLAYLKKLPLSKLKIDRAFVQNLPVNKDDVVIIRTIINLAKNLNLEIIAEGVETKVQKDFVFSEGVEYIQGYYYSKPIPTDEFEEKFLRI